jgi:phosphoglycolate phosphatase-like HAD superfamily hydrolase
VRLRLERAGLAPERAIYVGDSKIDAQAADGAPERTSSAWGARVLHPHRVATLGEVPAALERMFRRP